ncbi:hypothetical protein ABZP36_034474 [Zizania latifolia]
MERGRGRCGSCRLLAVAAAAVTVAAAMAAAGVEARLSPDHYRTTCPGVESIVRSVVARKVRETFVTVPATLRLFFHDCFVEVSDIDLLFRLDALDSSSGPHWTVELGRLDGLVSKAGSVAGRLPGPDMQVKELVAMFGKNDLTLLDMVALSGAHTVGFAHCTRFTGRLYRRGGVDPSYNPAYAQQLMAACPRDVGPTIAVDMDPTTPSSFDNTYYANLAGGLGLFTSDQALYADGASRPAVAGFAKNQTRFFEAFMDAMVKLGRVGVKAGRHGEIRRDCTAFNT